MIVDRRAERIAVVKPSGRLDRRAALEFHTELADVVAGGAYRLVVDLGAVSFIDSSGLGALIGGLKATRLAGGDLRIAQLGERAGYLLRLTSLDRVLRVYATVEDALAEYVD